MAGQPFQTVPLRFQPHQRAPQHGTEHDEQKHRQQRRNHNSHFSFS
jgi:hypothetical protein